MRASVSAHLQLLPIRQIRPGLAASQRGRLHRELQHAVDLLAAKLLHTLHRIQLLFEGSVRIEGQVEGEITAQDALVIGESAVVNAQINGTSIVIHGKVTGDVNARTRLEIQAPGKVFGNISVPCLVIHEGVVFEGQCTMGAGDTFQAALITWLTEQQRDSVEGVHSLSREHIDGMLNFAVRAAALTCSKTGPDLPYRHQLALH